MIHPMETRSPLQRFGLSPDRVKEMTRGLRSAPPAPVATAPYKPTRPFNTQYLDGEQQRMKKAVMHANEALIVGMIIQGVPIMEIALAFGVTDMAIRNRGKMFGVCPPPPSVRHGRLPIYRSIAQHEILRVEIDNYHAKRKPSAKKFDPRQLLLAGIN
jgi:hypothetical protein